MFGCRWFVGGVFPDGLDGTLEKAPGAMPWLWLSDPTGWQQVPN